MKPRKYVYKEYREEFVQLFEAEKRRLLHVVGDACEAIEHVGSTAVKELGGKGIIDIALAVPEEQLLCFRKKLESLGYIFRESGSVPERLFFRVDLPDALEGIRRYHLHLSFLSSIEWRTLISFRDYLRTHPEAAKEYAELKRKSADEVNEDGPLYRKQKAPFLQKVVRKALGHRLIFCIGASGAGKTTVLRRLENDLPTWCSLFHFDSIGVPSFEEMEQVFGSLEEWQRVKTNEWVERFACGELLKTHVLFDAQTRPTFIEEACKKWGLEYEVVLFDCSDEIRTIRLEKRGQPDLANQQMMGWAEYLRTQCQERNHKIINNTNLMVDETCTLFHSWLESCLSFQIDIPLRMVKKLIHTQFPEYEIFELKPVENQGWDNRTFRLGATLSVRMPSAKRYVAKVGLEQKWLPFLASKLSCVIPIPVAEGMPGSGYPWAWSIYKWIEGDTLDLDSVDDRVLDVLAVDIAMFLKELNGIDTTNGPVPGPHNFFRGGSLSVYTPETRSTIQNLSSYIDAEMAMGVWNLALDAAWDKRDVWVHGDMSRGNLLFKEGKLAAVIDFGGMAVGDPACDLTIAWTLFKGKSRLLFQERMNSDPSTWLRARGWALWKSLITFESMHNKKSEAAQKQLDLINELLRVE